MNEIDHAAGPWKQWIEEAPHPSLEQVLGWDSLSGVFDIMSYDKRRGCWRSALLPDDTGSNIIEYWAEVNVNGIPEEVE